MVKQFSFMRYQIPITLKQFKAAPEILKLFMPYVSKEYNRLKVLYLCKGTISE